MKLGTKVMLKEELRLSLESGEALVIDRGARGTVVGWLPSHPLGPTCRVRFRITEYINLEARVCRKQVIEEF